MNKVDLIEALRKETRLSRTKAKQVVELFFDEMSHALARGTGLRSGAFAASM